MKRKPPTFDVVGFDFGTKFGWAHLRVERGAVSRVDSGVWNLQPGKHQGGGMRFLACERYVKHCLITVRPEAVGYEAVARHMATDAAHIYGGFLAEVTKRCDEMEIPYSGYFPATLKKEATGSGRAEKSDVMVKLRRRFGLKTFKSDDEADAIAAALCVIRDLSLVDASLGE